MKILLITYQFPPYNTIGAIRTGKLAKYFTSHGHELRVITAKDPPLPSNLPLEIDPALVDYTPWFNVNFLPQMLFGGREQVSSKGYSSKSSAIKKLGFIYRVLLNFPDEQIGWLPFAVSKGMHIIREWKPDLIYASSPQATSLLVAKQLSHKTGIPWVAEMRDIWADPAVYPYPKWRLKIEAELKQKTLRKAVGLVTVSEPWAEELRASYSQPVACIANGYDPEDYPAKDELSSTDPNILRIIYPGVIYPVFREPSLLFDALRMMGKEADNIRVRFYTRYIDQVFSNASKYQVTHLIEGPGRITHREAVKAVMESDIALLLEWSDPANPDNQGIIPAKVFEYLAAKRPILAIGFGRDIASRIIRERKAGFVSNDPCEIAAQLRIWQAQKAELGYIPDLPAEVCEGYSRHIQFEKLERFLNEILHSS